MSSSITKLNVFILLIISFTIISCSKEGNSPKEGNPSLIGKWKLIEIFNGYFNGGDFQWQIVQKENTQIYEFMDNGGFVLKNDINGNNQICNGTYLVESDSILNINHACNTVIESFKIKDQTPYSLILERQVKEGKILYKYSPF